MANHWLRPRRRATRTFTRVAAFLCSIFAMYASAQSDVVPDFVAIVHPSNKVASLSTADMRDLLLANQKKWSRASSVHPILPKSKSPAMEQLLKRVLRMNSESELSMYFMAAIFQQKIAEPPKSGSHETAIAVVARDPGAVAFVPRSAVSGMRSIRIVEISGL